MCVLPTHTAQFIQAAVTGHLKQPGVERDIRQQDRQGEAELEKDVLEHIIHLLAVSEKAPDVARQYGAVAIHQDTKSGLITRQGPLDQDAIRDSLLPVSAFLLYRLCIEHRFLPFGSSKGSQGDCYASPP